MFKTYDSSRPVVGSVKVRKAWCGRFAVFPSTAVRSSFRLSPAPSDTDFANGEEGFSLNSLSILNAGVVIMKSCSLVLDTSANTGAFACNGHCGIFKAPGRCGGHNGRAGEEQRRHEATKDPHYCWAKKECM
jgi:hypothetical protein